MKRGFWVCNNSNKSYVSNKKHISTSAVMIFMALSHFGCIYWIHFFYSVMWIYTKNYKMRAFIRVSLISTIVIPGHWFNDEFVVCFLSESIYSVIGK